MTFTIDPTISMSFILAVITMVFTWWRTSRDKAEGRVKDLEADFNGRMKDVADVLGGQNQRIVSLEREIESMPSANEMHEIKLGLERMRGELSQQLAAIGATLNGQAEIVRRLEQIVSRHEDHLLGGGRK